METVYVKESNNEVWVFLGRPMSDRLTALREAAKIIQREVVREEFNRDRGIDRPFNND